MIASLLSPEEKVFQYVYPIIQDYIDEKYSNLKCIGTCVGDVVLVLRMYKMVA